MQDRTPIPTGRYAVLVRSASTLDMLVTEPDPHYYPDDPYPARLPDDEFYRDAGGCRPVRYWADRGAAQSVADEIAGRGKKVQAIAIPEVMAPTLVYPRHVASPGRANLVPHPACWHPEDVTPSRPIPDAPAPGAP